jgi:phage shock protein A
MNVNTICWIERIVNMTELTLISPHRRPLQPLVEAALRNELRLLEANIQRTEQRLQEFEHRHGLSTAEFISQYENDELAETLELAEWIGEHRLLERLQEKADVLREIRFAN